MVFAGRAALLVVLSVAALCWAPTAFAELADQTALAQRYAPVVRLREQTEECGYGKPYTPIDVDVLTRLGQWSGRAS